MTPKELIAAARAKGLEVTERKTAKDHIGMLNLPKTKKSIEVRTDTPIRWAIEFSISCRVISESNQRKGWQGRWKRGKAQASALSEAVYNLSYAGVTMPDANASKALIVTWTHIGPEMDDDNLRSALKGLRDHLAEWLGLPNDRDPRVEWRYDQRRGRPGVEVRIESREETR